MAIEIYALPAANKLAHLDVQFFHNVPKPGIAQYVLKVQYRTHKGKEQRFVVPLTADFKHLGRKVRSKLPAEDAKAVQELFKDFRDKGLAPMFGFRQVTLTQRTPKGGRIFQRLQDAETSVWFRTDGDKFKVSIAWAGEVINLAITPHKEVWKEGQSLGIGYWNRKEHLKKKLESMNEERADSDQVQDHVVEEVQEQNVRPIGLARPAEPSGLLHDGAVHGFRASDVHVHRRVRRGHVQAAVGVAAQSIAH